MAPLGACLLAFCLAFSGSAAAQDTATLTGQVTSRDGTPLSGAQISAQDVLGRGVSAYTDGAGQYVLDLQPGTYRLTARLLGFNEAQAEVSLTSGVHLKQDLQLSIGTLVDEVTVTAAKGLEQRTVEVPQIVTTISADTIQQRNLQSVADALERAPGFYSIDPNPARARPSYRGLASSRVLILVDGERLNNVRFDAGATGVSPSMIDVAQVESIEVLGGAGSSLYGTDAMAGVIHIVTRQPTAGDGTEQLDLHFDLHYDANSDFTKGVVTADYRAERWAWRTLASAFQLDGWSAGNGEVRQEDVLEAARFAQEAAQAAGGDLTNSYAIWQLPAGAEVRNAQAEGHNFQTDLWWFPDDRQTLELKFLSSQHEDLGQPFSIPPTDPTQRLYAFRDLTKLTARYQRFGLADWLPSLELRAFRQRFERPQNDARFNIDPGSSFEPDTRTFTGDLSSFTRGREQVTLNDVTSSGFDLQAKITVGTSAVLSSGLSWSYDASEDTFSFEAFAPDGSQVFYGEQDVATTPDTDYENTALYTVLDWQPASWVRLSGGLRWDRWETEAKPSVGYPPVQETAILEAALPLLANNPGDLVLDGLAGLDGLISGQSGVSTRNDEWTGNLGLTFFTDWGVNPYIRWAESYREPEVTVRYLVRNFGSPTFHVTGLPNTALQSEEGTTLDLGLKVDRLRWRGQVGYFTNDIENFIGTVQSPVIFSPAFLRPDLGLLSPVGLFFQRINFGEVHFEGYEASFQGSFPLANGAALSPYLTYSHLRSENETPTPGQLTVVDQFFGRNDTPRRFEGSPNDVPFGSNIGDQATLGLRYTAPNGRWFLEYELRWVDDIHRVDPNDLSSANLTQYGPFASLEGYEKHTVRGGYTFGTALPIDLHVAVENLSDAFYFEPFQLAPAPGRSVIVGVRIPWRNVLGH